MQVIYKMEKAFLFLLLLWAATGKAQFLDNNALYFNCGVSAGNYNGLRLGVNVIHKEMYSLQAGFMGLIRGAKSKPDDYSGGLVNALLLGLASPYDEVESYELLVGKVVQLNETKTIRLNLKSGATVASFTEPTNWQKVSDGLLGPNYTFENRDKKVLGLVINPEIEFPVARVFGVALSPYGIISKENLAAGVEVKLLLGLLK